MSTLYENENLEKNYIPRIEILVLVVVLITAASWFLTGNILAGLIMGFFFGLIARGIRKYDKTIRDYVWIRPIWLKSLTIIAAIGSSYLWLTKTFVLKFLLINDNSSNIWFAVLFSAISLILSVFLTGWGNWKNIKNNNLIEKAKNIFPRTPAQKALNNFSTETLAKAGLTTRDPVSGALVAPKIVSKEIDKKERPQIVCEIVAGAQTQTDWIRLNDKIASAWQVPSVLVKTVRREDVVKSKKNSAMIGNHLIQLTGVLKEVKFEGGFVNWELPKIDPLKTNITQYVSSLYLGKYCDDGERLTLNLREKMILVGGQSGSGKSSFINAILANLILHPDNRVVYIDLKEGIEARNWKKSISGTIDNPEDALKFLRSLAADFMSRSEDMKNTFVSEDVTVTNAWNTGYLGPEHPLKVVIIDEVPELFKTGTKREREIEAEANVLLSSLVRRGRAAGYSFILAAQKPSLEVIPSQVRSQLTDLVCFHGDDSVTRMVFGSNDFIDIDISLDPRFCKTGEGIYKPKNDEYRKVHFAYLEPTSREDLLREYTETVETSKYKLEKGQINEEDYHKLVDPISARYNNIDKVVFAQELFPKAQNGGKKFLNENYRQYLSRISEINDDEK